MNIENMKIVRDLMEKRGPDKFDMNEYIEESYGDRYLRAVVDLGKNACGTSGCIAGTAAIAMVSNNIKVPGMTLKLDSVLFEIEEFTPLSTTREWLEIDQDLALQLFMPSRYDIEDVNDEGFIEIYYIDESDIDFGHALAMMDRLIEGLVDLDEPDSIIAEWDDIVNG